MTWPGSFSKWFGKWRDQVPLVSSLADDVARFL
jgi:hypothetical protein